MKNNKLITYSKLILIILSIVTNVIYLVAALKVNSILFPILDIVSNLLILITYTILVFNSKDEYNNHLMNLFVLTFLSLLSIFLNIIGLGCGEGCETNIHAGIGIGIFIFPVLIITNYSTNAVLNSINESEIKEITTEKSNNFVKYLKSLLLIFSLLMNITLIILSCEGMTRYSNDGSFTYSLAMGCLGIIFNTIICILYVICIHFDNDIKFIKVVCNIVLGGVTAVSVITNIISLSIEDPYTVMIANSLGLVIPVLYILAYIVLKILASKKGIKTTKDDEIYIAIKVKSSYVKIDPLNKIFCYKNEVVAIEDITDLEISGKNEYVEKSNLGEAILCGALFGGLGAAAGSIAGNRTKKVKWCDVYIKTKNPFTSVVWFKAKYENAIKVCNTIFLLAKENSLDIKE